MTQGQIEKAATDQLLNGPFELRETSVGAFQQGFVNGARWRIDSVWHDRAENASMDNGEIVFVFPDGSAMTKSVLGWNWEDIQEHFKFVKWAYMKDLLPTEE